MNSLTRQGKFIVFGGLAVILLVAGIYFYYIANRGTDHPGPASEELIKQNAADTLKHVVDVANELSGITSGAVFNFEIDAVDGRSANFGMYRLDSEVGGESLVEEHFVTFRNQNYTSEVAQSGGVVAMHRPVPEFAVGSGRTFPVEELEARARQFVERIYPEFASIESKLEYDPGSKSAPGVATNHFFRWNDKNYRKTLPSGVEIDLDPFIQVGITASGFIFSYNNTVPLYWSCEAWDSPSCIPIQ